MLANPKPYCQGISLSGRERGWVVQGLEPATKCLKGACSTIELTTRGEEPETISHHALQHQGEYGLGGPDNELRPLRKSSFSDSVIPSLSRDQFRLSFFRGTELILRLRFAPLRMTDCLDEYFSRGLELSGPPQSPLASLYPGLVICRTLFMKRKSLPFGVGMIGCGNISNAYFEHNPALR